MVFLISWVALLCVSMVDRIESRGVPGLLPPRDDTSGFLLSTEGRVKRFVKGLANGRLVVFSDMRGEARDVRKSGFLGVGDSPLEPTEVRPLLSREGE